MINAGEIAQALMIASDRNGYIKDKGANRAQATIRSSLSAGIQRPRIFNR
jgi:hypothetical protein